MLFFPFFIILFRWFAFFFLNLRVLVFKCKNSYLASQILHSNTDIVNVRKINKLSFDMGSITQVGLGHQRQVFFLSFSFWFFLFCYYKEKENLSKNWRLLQLLKALSSLLSRNRAVE